MSDPRRSSKRKRRKAIPVLGTAGLSLSLASGASATPAPDVPEWNTAECNKIILADEEISDVSLATFHVFDSENDSPLRRGIKVAAGHDRSHLPWVCRLRWDLPAMGPVSRAVDLCLLLKVSAISTVVIMLIRKRRSLRQPEQPDDHRRYHKYDDGGYGLRPARVIDARVAPDKTFWAQVDGGDPSLLSRLSTLFQCSAVGLPAAFAISSATRSRQRLRHSRAAASRLRTSGSVSRTKFS
jgi:hypothetical protein